MFKRKHKSSSITIPVPAFLCEWNSCLDAFNSSSEFYSHVEDHIQKLLKDERISYKVSSSCSCSWTECWQKIDGTASDVVRHVLVHAFHTKVKENGRLVMESQNLPRCQLPCSSRNLVPELPSSLLCNWDNCGILFDNPELFYRHVSSHAEQSCDTKSKFRCLWLGCEGIVKDNRCRLRDHLRSHTQEKLVACPSCGGLFANNTKFADHLFRQAPVTGSGYSCDKCSKVYATSRLLRAHMYSHQERFKCDLCDTYATTLDNLRVHFKFRHSDERPFKCDECPKSYKSEKDLRRHTDVHGRNVYSCYNSDCPDVFSSYIALSKHVKAKHKDAFHSSSSYQCHICSKTFKYSTAITSHLRKCHNIERSQSQSRLKYCLCEDGYKRLMVKNGSFSTNQSQLIQVAQTPSLNNTAFAQTASPEQLLADTESVPVSDKGNVELTGDHIGGSMPELNSPAVQQYQVSTTSSECADQTTDSDLHVNVASELHPCIVPAAAANTNNATNVTVMLSNNTQLNAYYLPGVGILIPQGQEILQNCGDNKSTDAVHELTIENL